MITVGVSVIAGDSIISGISVLVLEVVGEMVGRIVGEMNTSSLFGLETPELLVVNSILTLTF